MASLDRHGSVIYIGKLTKTLARLSASAFPGRTGKFIRHATSLRKALDTQGDSLMENAIAGMYKDAPLPVISKVRKAYKERRDHSASCYDRAKRSCGV